jgi:hypothetical protein
VQGLACVRDPQSVVEFKLADHIYSTQNPELLSGMSPDLNAIILSTVLDAVVAKKSASPDLREMLARPEFWEAFAWRFASVAGKLGLPVILAVMERVQRVGFQSAGLRCSFAKVLLTRVGAASGAEAGMAVALLEPGKMCAESEGAVEEVVEKVREAAEARWRAEDFLGAVESATKNVSQRGRGLLAVAVMMDEIALRHLRRFSGEQVYILLGLLEDAGLRNGLLMKAYIASASKGVWTSSQQNVSPPSA